MRRSIVPFLPDAEFSCARDLWGWALAIGVLAGCTSAPVLRGPMPVRNQHPVQNTVLHMDPTSVEARPAGSVALAADAAYSSLFLSARGRGADAGNSFTMDGELLRTTLRADLALGHGLSLQLQLPTVHATGGFLDGFIIDWHDVFGLPDQNRTTSPRNQFEVTARRDGNVVYRLDNTDLALLDVPIGLQWNVQPVDATHPFGFGVRAAVELPTGDADRGFGNGGVDVSVGAVGELRFAAIGVTGHVQHTFAHTPDVARAGGLHFADVTSAGLAAELPMSDRWSLMAQSEIETTTLRDLDFGEVSRPQWLLWLGLRTHLRRDLWLDVAIAEDLTTDAPPDFTLWLGLGFRTLATAAPAR